MALVKEKSAVIPVYGENLEALNLHINLVLHVYRSWPSKIISTVGDGGRMRIHPELGFLLFEFFDVNFRGSTR